ncbi:MAG: FAD-binding protein [Betaproteobacteria bacterium]|nr:FAD-binding protein [Betaproteobacteria bacterium]
MNAPLPMTRTVRPGDSALAARLRRAIEGDVLFDPASRGRYATDASIYQIEPLGVVVPRTEQDVQAVLEIAREQGVPVLPRGAGTSQCGQTVGEALVIDTSRHLDGILEVDPEARTALVQPGVVLDHLNAHLRRHRLWYPVDVSTSAQATLGGMAGNNSCGARSIRYGNMVHNVAAIDAWLADGTACTFGPSGESHGTSVRYREIVQGIHAIARREAAEIAARWPRVLRRVQGYNLDMVLPDRDHNLAHLLVGSEGTLAWFRRLRLRLAPIPPRKVLGVAHFPTFYAAMDLTREIVKLDPDAVELVDRTMIGLAREHAEFRPVVEQFFLGRPDAILLVEFAGEDEREQLDRLHRLDELLADHGHPGAVVKVTDAAQQRAIWEVRKAGLNIMMSMKGDGKPVSFIEDCAVPLEHLAEYTRRLDEVFAKHGTRGTWYAHASVGTLHVRPVLNMKADGALKMRAIAEEACELVKAYKGAYSGEHGDGLVRSEWIEPILGPRLTHAFAEIKSLFDPDGMFNPGKIVRPPRMDDRTLFRYGPDYRPREVVTGLDWSGWNGISAAVEMCNNNGHCRKFDAGTMCPSYRITREEQHLTRGRANTLRLALSGQLGIDGLTAPEVDAAMSLCVGCKGCRRECPTGVDMARLKLEWKHQHSRTEGPGLRDRLVGYLPRYAPLASRLAVLANAPRWLPGADALLERLAGLAARRSLPKWRGDAFRDDECRDTDQAAERKVLLFADTFNRYFEPENLRATVRVLRAFGYSPTVLAAPPGERPLCCGRTFLAAGLLDEARAEARRVLNAARSALQHGWPIVGLEPSCVFTFADEYSVLSLGSEARDLAAATSTLEEFLVRENDAGRIENPVPRLARKALLHGHCHQKAFGAFDAVVKTLRLVPGLDVTTIESSCCGMAGSFGFEAEHVEQSRAMGELSLLPAVRASSDDTLIVADGTSCRHQIADGASREAWHVSRVLDLAFRDGVHDGEDEADR